MHEGRTDLGSALLDWRRETAHHSGRTVYDLGRCAARWIAAWGDACPMAELDSERVREYVLTFRGAHAGSTTNQEVKYLRWFLRHAERRGFIARAPLSDLPHFPEEHVEPHALKDREVAELLEKADEELRALLLLAVETGLRRSTILALRWEWIDLSTGWIKIPPKFMKGRRQYRAPLSHQAIAALRSLCASVEGPVFRFSRSTVGRRMTRAVVRSAIDDTTFHDLRRTFFSRMRERGVPLEVAMALSDHRDVRTALRHYRAISAEELLRAVGRGDAPSAGAGPAVS